LVEANAREAAARLGVADFVMIPKDRFTGSGQREISDGCLVVGDEGAVLQVKSRLVESLKTDDAAKVARWLEKNVRKAVRQGRGTLRTLGSAATPVTLQSVRSLDAPPERRAEFERALPSDVSAWPIIVVVDYPGLPPASVSVDDDVFVVTLDDWWFLHQAIRSTAGMLIYVRRVLAQRDVVDVPLGQERARFEEICRADAATNDGSSTWAPWLSHAALDDPQAADTFQHFIDRTWPQGEALPATQPGEYLRIVEFLDRVPPAIRVALGRQWLGYIQATVDSGRRSGIALLPGGSIVMLIEHTHETDADEKFRAVLGALAAVRSVEVATRFGPRPLLAIGVLTHPGATDYLFLRADGPEAFNPVPEEITQAVQADFGSLADRAQPV
jgi:hypothetical protein